MKQKVEMCEVNGFVIDHSARLFSNMSKLYLNSKCSDVCLKIEDKILPAHRFILAANSNYFRTMFYGEMAESNQREITLHVQYDAFKLLLKYFYTGQLSLVNMAESMLLEILQLADRYNLNDIVAQVFNSYFENLNIDNAFKLLWIATVCNQTKMYEKATEFIDSHSCELIQNEPFKFLPKEVLMEVIKRDSFYAQELDILNAVIGWSKNNPTEDINPILEFIRFKSINNDHLNELLFKSGSMFQQLAESINKNRATSTCQPRMSGIHLEKIDSEKENMYVWSGPTKILLSNVVFQLPDIQRIDFIEMTLPYGHFKYFIECSHNGISWDKIVDFSKNHCHSRQLLRFKSCISLYIRVVSVGQKFWIEKFAAGNRSDETELSTIKPFEDCLVIRGQSLIAPSYQKSPSDDGNVDNTTEIVIHYNRPINMNCLNVTVESFCKYVPRLSISRDGENWQFGAVTGRKHGNLIEYIFSMRPVSFIRLKFYDIDRPINVLEIKHKPGSWEVES